MMDFRHFSKAFLAAATFALAVTSLPAAAQWMWKDEAGHVIASDQAPPPGTPASRIMKAPRQKPVNVVAPADPAADAAKADAAKAEPPKSVADRELDAKLKQKEQADAAKKADEEATRTQALKDNCASVRSNVAALQAGGRAARFNEKGEKVYIGDNERQAEIAKQQGQVAQYCKS